MRVRRIWGGLLAAALIVTGLSAAPAGAATKVTHRVDLGGSPYGAGEGSGVYGNVVGTDDTGFEPIKYEQSSRTWQGPVPEPGTYDTVVSVTTPDHYVNTWTLGQVVKGATSWRLDVEWAPMTWRFVDAAGRPTPFAGWWQCDRPVGSERDQAGGRVVTKGPDMAVPGMPAGDGWRCWMSTQQVDQAGSPADAFTVTRGGVATYDVARDRVRLDTAKPTVTGAATRRPSASGWYRGDVRVRWSAASAGERLTSPADTVLRGKQGKRLVLRSTPVCNAIGCTTGAMTVNVDRTKPTVRVRGVRQGATYRKGAVPTRRCGASDRLSGLAKACRVTTTGGDRRGLGRFTRTAVAVDRAGNKAVARVSFVVRR